MLWDTMATVRPPACRPAIRLRNSSRAWGSSPATGSSRTSVEGSMARTPANATRRCCPPESSKGLLARSASKSKWTLSKARRTRRSTSSSSSPRLRGPNATSSYTVAANSWCSGYWNTMPMRPRAACAAFLSERSWPSASTRPSVGCISPFMCWMSVLLPLPVCPAMPKNSPSSREKLMSRSVHTASAAPPHAGLAGEAGEGAADAGPVASAGPVVVPAVPSGPAAVFAAPTVASAASAARRARSARFRSRRRCFSERSGSR